MSAEASSAGYCVGTTINRQSGGGADAKLRAAIRTVAVIGAGRVGRSFALACAAAGFDVVLEDVMPANLRRAQEEYADLASQRAGARGAA